MRTSFTHVLSLMSVNATKVYAGGFHSWVLLDETTPKRDEFQGLNVNDSASPRDIGSVMNNSQMDMGSSWNYQVAKQAKFLLQVNYTDTAMSHRFVRFELPDRHLEQGKAKIEEYIRSIYLEEPGTVYHKLQEDEDLTGEGGQIASAGRGKTGKFFTLQIVSDLKRLEEPPAERRDLVKGDYTFID